MEQYKVLGINDEQDHCELCGKAGIKRVVWLEDSDGAIMAVGTTCAGYLLYGRRTRANSARADVCARAMVLAAKLAAAGHAATEIATGVWNRTGLSTEVREGVAYVWCDGERVALLRS